MCCVWPAHHTPGRSSRIFSRTPVSWSRNQSPPIFSILETFRVWRDIDINDWLTDLLIYSLITHVCNNRWFPPSFALSMRADFGLSYAPRGELLDYIHKLDCFDENCTRFYAAETVVALEYLHRLGIIHRWGNGLGAVADLSFSITIHIVSLSSNHPWMYT